MRGDASRCLALVGGTHRAPRPSSFIYRLAWASAICPRLRPVLRRIRQVSPLRVLLSGSGKLTQKSLPIIIGRQTTACSWGGGPSHKARPTSTIKKTNGRVADHPKPTARGGLYRE